MKYIKTFESMIVDPIIDYSKYNLKCDGINPRSKYAFKKDAINGITECKRRVAWLDLTKEELKDLPNNVGYIRLFNVNDINDYSYIIYKEKNIKLFGKYIDGAKSMFEKETIIYNKNYKIQAIKVRRELLRRGGFWKVTDPKSDIYLARLMGYGEEYIVPYIKKYFPDFDIETYIKNNPRKELLKNNI